MTILIGTLLGDHSRHVAFQCTSCGWSGMVALDVNLTNEEIVEWFSCQLDGHETQVRVINLKRARGRG